MEQCGGIGSWREDGLMARTWGSSLAVRQRDLVGDEKSGDRGSETEELGGMRFFEFWILISLGYRRYGFSLKSVISYKGDPKYIISSPLPG